MFFDPLGLICPIVLQSKLIFKTLCMNKLNWGSLTYRRCAEEMEGSDRPIFEN